MPVTNKSKKYSSPVVFILLLLHCFYGSRAQPLAVTQQYACNRAAVVMIRTDFEASINVSQVTINAARFNHLLDSIEQLELDSFQLTAGQKLDVVLQAFSSHASRYFKPTLKYFRHTQRVAANGSGFIVRGDGHVVTNCHVVDEDDDYIRRRFILSAFKQVTESGIAAIESAWSVKFTEQQRQSLYNTFSAVYLKLLPITLNNLKKQLYVVVNEEDENGISRMRTIPAVIVSKGESMPGKDVAILKMAADREMPVIRLSTDDKVPVGAPVYVYGYPGPVARNDYLSPETLQEPTLTSGIVSAWKKTTRGWEVMQMDANINHGNSGGPVCNAAGEVIGMTTFGSFDNVAGALAPGLNFAIPVSIIQTFLANAAIEPRESEVTLLFKQGIIQFDQRYYRKAAQLFEQVQAKDANYPGIGYYMKTCRSYIEQGKDEAPGAMVYIQVFFIVACAVAIVYFVSWQTR
jgi:serine protease Do